MQDTTHLILQYLKTTEKNSIPPVPSSFLLAIKEERSNKL